jgi:hypothetical protein
MLPTLVSPPCLPRCLSEGTLMPEVTCCADNLVLLGEMLGVASEYIKRCEETLGKEDAFMVELAHSQLFFLRERVAKLDHRLRDLEVKLRPKAQGAHGQ